VSSAWTSSPTTIPRGERARRAADRDEADPARPGSNLSELVGTDARHRPGPELELAVFGDERRGPAERDVDLRLVRIECLGAVVVVRVAVPVRK